MNLLVSALALALATPAQTTSMAPAVAAPVSTDPARLAAALPVAAKLMPGGTYRTMMKSVFDQLTGNMTKQMLDMPMRDIVRAAGISEADAAKIGPATARQIMAVVDPAFDERMQITMRVMMGEMTEVLASFEPAYRDGLADALAESFTVEQLGELDRFFATPTGRAYAGQSMLLYTSPAMMQRMQLLMPKVMQAMPAIMTKVTAATAHLPKMREPKDFTPAEREKLEALIAPVSGAQE